MRWCARCGEPINDGLLLCAACVPRSELRQSANVRLDKPPGVVIGPDGQIQEMIPGTGTTTVKAYKVPQKGGQSRSRLRAVEKLQWIHDRQRYERTVWLYDHLDRVYSETCFDPETGEITWGTAVSRSF